jgi:hypothetical protein
MEKPFKTLAEILGSKLEGDEAEASNVYNRWYKSDLPYDELPRHDRYVIDVWLFYVDVMNGGLDEFFARKDGGYWRQTLEAFDAIGAKNTFELVQNACSLFPNGQPSADLETRSAQLRAITTGPNKPPFCSIGDLVEGQMDENLFELVMNYRRRHARSDSTSKHS